MKRLGNLWPQVMAFENLLRAAASPRDTNCSKSARSSAVKVTRYLSMSAVLFLGWYHRLTAKNQGTAVTCQMKIDGPLGGVVADCSACQAPTATFRFPELPREEPFHVRGHRASGLRSRCQPRARVEPPQAQRLHQREQ